MSALVIALVSRLAGPPVITQAIIQLLWSGLALVVFIALCARHLHNRRRPPITRGTPQSGLVDPAATAPGEPAIPVDTLLGKWYAFAATLPTQSAQVDKGSPEDALHFGIGYGLLWLLEETGAMPPDEAAAHRAMLSEFFSDPGNYEPIPNN